MLPRNLHLGEINRFHDKLESLTNRIKAEQDREVRLNLSMEHYELCKLWEKIDTFIEFTLKIELDSMENK